jgi:hypothetical protein
LLPEFEEVVLGNTKPEVLRILGVATFQALGGAGALVVTYSNNGQT